MGDTMTWKELYKAQPIDYVQLIADGETPVWDKNLEKFIAKGSDSEGESSFKVPKKDLEQNKEASKSDDDNEEEPF